MNNTWNYWIFEHDFLSAGLLARNENLVLIDITRGKDDFISWVTSNYSGCKPDKKPFLLLIQELTEYLEGKRKQFEIKCNPEVSPFYKKVFIQTSLIPYGEVRTYKEIAESTGRPNAARAVGTALAANPLPILIPCHRVIKSDGTLGGFGGGTSLKKKLLSLEGLILGKKPGKNNQP